MYLHGTKTVVRLCPFFVSGSRGESLGRNRRRRTKPHQKKNLQRPGSTPSAGRAIRGRGQIRRPVDGLCGRRVLPEIKCDGGFWRRQRVVGSKCVDSAGGPSATGLGRHAVRGIVSISNQSF